MKCTKNKLITSDAPAMVANTLSFSNTTSSIVVAAVMSFGILFSLSSQAAEPLAEESQTAEVAYVDSVHEWGAWGLDIEPAAGGIQPQSTQPVHARSSKVTLRTNSFSAIAPPPPPVIAQAPLPTPIPVPPVVPVTPPAPPVVPPIGGPASGLF